MDLNFDDGDGAEIEIPLQPAQELSETKLLTAQHILYNGTNQAVCKLRWSVMLHLCKELECSPKKDSKKFLVNELLAYVSLQYLNDGSVANDFN